MRNIVAIPFIVAFLIVAVAASAQSLDQAILEWDSSGPLAQEYRIYRAGQKADGSCPLPPYGQPIDTVPADTLTYTDAPLQYNKAFCWYVTAWNVDQPESGASNLVTKRIPFPASPPAPANLRVRLKQDTR